MKRNLMPLICLAIVCTVLTMLGLLSSGKTLSDGVSILNPKQNIHGDGYEWHNPSDTLTLDNLNISTDDDYGLKLPDGATVILKGKNYIKASKAALYVGGDVVIRGSGSLILEGGETGILCNSIDTTDKLSITGGTYTVKGGKDGISAPYTEVALSGGKLTISGGENAINVRELLTSAGVTIDASGRLYSSYSMLLQGTNLSAEADGAVLVSDGTMKLESMSIKAGASLASLSDSENYSGENAIKTVSTLDTALKSILFGEKYSIALDIIILVSAAAILAAAIVLPPVLKKKKAQAVIALNKLAEAEEAKQRKAAKKKEA